jgi:hypothetical protein
MRLIPLLLVCAIPLQPAAKDEARGSCDRGSCILASCVIRPPARVPARPDPAVEGYVESATECEDSDDSEGFANSAWFSIDSCLSTTITNALVISHTCRYGTWLLPSQAVPLRC